MMRALMVMLALLYVRTTTKSSTPPCPGPAPIPLEWRQVTIPYVVDEATTPDVPGGAVDAVRTSFQTWDDVASSFITLRFDGTLANAPVGYQLGGSNVNVVKWIESGWMASARAIAVTLVTFDCNTGQILDADITLNGQSFTFTTAPGTGMMAADVQNTVTHEAGHLLGFDHSPDPESTMYADAPLGETKKRDLTADDTQGLCDVYGLGHEPPPDAGAADASAPQANDGGGCTVAGREADANALLFAVFVLIWALTSRPASSSRTPPPSL